MKTLLRVIATGFLMLGANIASATLLQIQVETLAAGGSHGSWELTRDSFYRSESWTHTISLLNPNPYESDTWNVNIGPGEYLWSIDGVHDSLAGLVAWTLRLDGQQIYSNSHAGTAFKAKLRVFEDDYSVEVIGVPEPATLTLLGLGLGVLGLATRRRSPVAKANA